MYEKLYMLFYSLLEFDIECDSVLLVFCDRILCVRSDLGILEPRALT